jgi:hypothetical protein
MNRASANVERYDEGVNSFLSRVWIYVDTRKQVGRRRAPEGVRGQRRRPSLVRRARYDIEKVNDAILSKRASLRLPNAALVSYHQWMPSKPIELPPAAARRFVEDMRAFFKETNQIKQDEIAARQLHALRHYYVGKLRLTDVRKMFLQMRDHS